MIVFGIEIRNKVTGRAVTLESAQAVADFLAGLDKSEWEGFQCLGELPTPTQLVKAESDASPIVDTSVNSVAGDLSVLPDGTIVVAGGLPLTMVLPTADHSDTTLVVGDTFADKTVAVGDSGKGDSYLPASED